MDPTCGYIACSGAWVTPLLEATCDGATGKTWLPFPAGAGRTHTVYAEVATDEVFKAVGDNDNPGCFLSDIIGKPKDGASELCPVVSGAARAPAVTTVTALLLASAALFNAIIA